jgi:hypothetical protein
MDREIAFVAAVAIVAAVWVVADGYARRVRHQTERLSRHEDEQWREEGEELLDANSLSASDD